MKQGYISIYRKMQDSWFWRVKPFSPGQAWVDMLLYANHSAADILFNGKILKIERGSFVTSLEALKIRWGWSRKKLNRWVGRWTESGQLVSQNLSYKGTRITICNYDTYQNGGTAKEQAKEQAKGKPRESQGTINNNDNNDIMKERNTIYTFFDFWETYAKKVGRSKAERKYAKISEKDRAVIKTKLPEYVKSTPDVKFRKNPETWLNGRHWEDEIIKQRTWDDF